MTGIYKPKGRAAEYAYLAVNQYTGCDNNCCYCYQRKMETRFGKTITKAVPKKGTYAAVKKDLESYMPAPHDRAIVQMSFSCDPYPAIESSGELTRSLIRLFRKYDWPFSVLTKSPILAMRDFDLYGKHDWFGVTLTFTSTYDSKQHEPFADLPSDRILALKRARDMGIKTWASIEPVIDPQQSLELIALSADYVDLFKIGKLNHKSPPLDEDWRFRWLDFGTRAVDLCRDRHVGYYVKKDLRDFMCGVQLDQYDNRFECYCGE